MLHLRLSDWELIQRLLEARELKLRLHLEADFLTNTLPSSQMVREYHQVCGCLECLAEPKGRMGCFLGSRLLPRTDPPRYLTLEPGLFARSSPSQP